MYFTSIFHIRLYVVLFRRWGTYIFAFSLSCVLYLNAYIFLLWFLYRKSCVRPLSLFQYKDRRPEESIVNQKTPSPPSPLLPAASHPPRVQITNLIVVRSMFLIGIVPTLMDDWKRNTAAKIEFWGRSCFLWTLIWNSWKSGSAGIELLRWNGFPELEGAPNVAVIGRRQLIALSLSRTQYMHT
jgi:hypothetical protein